MRVLVVQESMFGNTAEIARAIAGALSRCADVRLLAAADAPADPGPDLDLVIVGAPTHGLTLPTAASRRGAGRGASPSGERSGVREWLEALPEGRPWQVATFCTKMRRGGPFAGSAARAAARILRRRGYRVRTAADFFVAGTTGPLLPGERERAAEWAADLLPSSVGA